MQNFRWGLIAAISALVISVGLGIFSNVGLLYIILRGFIFGAVFFGLGFGLRFVLNSFFPELLFNEDEAIQQEPEQPGSRIDITVDNTSGEYAVPELYKFSGDSSELGNIEDLISGVFRPGYAGEEQKSSGFAPVMSSMEDKSVDSGGETGYNDVDFFQDLTPQDGDSFQDTSVFERPPVEKQPVDNSAAFQPQFTPSFGDDSGLGGLPDLDMMARAFSSAYSSSPAMAPIQTPSPAASAPPMSAMPAMPIVEEIQPDRSQYTGNKPQPLQGDFHAKDIAKGLSTLLNKDK